YYRPLIRHAVGLGIVFALPAMLTIGMFRASSGFTIGADSSNPALVPNTELQLSGSGASRTLTITPAANEFGMAVITVTVSDGGANMRDSFTLTVLPVNDPPVAANDTYSATEDTPLAIAAPGVLANDGDAE